MSLSAKNLGLIVISVLFFTIACKEKEKIGLDPSTLIGVAYTDTFNLSTKAYLKDDDINYSQKSFLFSGAYADPVFGNISAESYTQLLQETDTINATGYTTVESVELNLEVDYHYGDTNQNQTLKVYKVDETISPDLTYYTNHNSLTTTGGAIDNDISFQLRPSTKNQTITLNNSFGDEVLTFVAGGGKSKDVFSSQFKGIVIKAKNNNEGAIFGVRIGSKSNITITYKKENQTRTLKLILGGGRFTKIISDRTTAPLSGLTATGSQVDLNGKVYIQTGTGVYTKVFFPGLDSLKKKLGKAAVNRAELIFKLDDPSVISYFRPEVLLSPIKLNAAGEISKVTRPTDGAVIFDYVQREYADVDGLNSPIESIYNSTTNSYNFVISTYVHAILNGQLENNGIIIANPLLVGFNRTIAGTGTGSVVLKLYLTSIKD